jgi:hypothetical protein
MLGSVRCLNLSGEGVCSEGTFELVLFCMWKNACYIRKCILCARSWAR